jgi:xanthine/uracil/vitamin C permease (AzgA family)
MALLDRLFRLRDHDTTVGTELRAGLTTFLTMCYIIVVQPIILSGAGLSTHTVFIATCISSAVATLLMAFFANYPIALAPAMGHNILFLHYCRNGTVNWQTALGAVFISGSIFLLLSLFGLRAKIIRAVPSSLKHAIAVGIGLLIAFLGFQWAGIAVDNPATLVQKGNLHSPPVLLALGGLTLTAILIAIRLRGAILIGILATALAGIPLGLTSTTAIEAKGPVRLPAASPMADLVLAPTTAAASIADQTDATTRNVVDRALADAAKRHYDGNVAPPRPQRPVTVVPRLTSAPAGVLLSAVATVTVPPEKKGQPAVVKEWRTYGPVPLPGPGQTAKLDRFAEDVILGLPGHSGLLELDIAGALKLGLLHVIFIFFFLDLFDTIGTLIGVSQQAGLLRDDGTLPRARPALLADAAGTVLGAGLGTSTVTSYVESSAGVAEGGRTGLSGVVTAALFLLALLFWPVVEMIGSPVGGLHPAVAPVLIIIGSIMVRNVIHVDWTDPTEALPAFLAIMMMPLTFSITDGIAFGFISYALLKLITGRYGEVHWLVSLFAGLFVVRYVCISV